MRGMLYRLGEILIPAELRAHLVQKDGGLFRVAATHQRGSRHAKSPHFTFHWTHRASEQPVSTRMCPILTLIDVREAATSPEPFRDTVRKPPSSR